MVNAKNVWFIVRYCCLLCNPGGNPVESMLSPVSLEITQWCSFCIEHLCETLSEAFWKLICKASTEWPSNKDVVYKHISRSFTSCSVAGHPEIKPCFCHWIVRWVSHIVHIFQCVLMKLMMWHFGVYLNVLYNTIWPNPAHC